MKVSAALLLASLTLAKGYFTEHCLTCMCDGYDGCVMPDPPCFQYPWGYECGPFKFNEAYWTDAGGLSGSIEECGSNWTCSEQTVRNYVVKYEGTNNTCENYARVHMGGRWGMHSQAANDFWNSIKACVVEPTPYPQTLPSVGAAKSKTTTKTMKSKADAAPFHPRNMDTST